MSKLQFTIEDARAASRRAEHQQQQSPQDGSPYVDSDNQRVIDDTSADSIADQYLSSRDGVTLREEAATVKGRAARWKSVVDAFEDYIWRQRKAAKEWERKKGITPTSHRFTEQASKNRYGRTLGADRAAYRLWGDDLTTVHVVRRARPFGIKGQPQPPADHLKDLLSANSNVYRAYDRHIGDNHGLAYARLSVLEPHRNGYGHIHEGLWVNDPDDVVDEIDIEPAVEAHLRAVDQAQPRNHTNAVDVRNTPKRAHLDGDPQDQPPTTALPRELTKYLGGLAPHDESQPRNPNAPNVVQAAVGPLRFYTLLWAMGVRQWRPDAKEFPCLVKASQSWWGDDGGEAHDEQETYPDPEDIKSDSQQSKVTVDSRPVDFEPFEAKSPLQQ
jgi:hypothetical protein